MPAAPNHLVEIYRQLNEHFSSHPAINIAPTKGDPPDQYEITYNIKGLSKSGRGEIVEKSQHTIELTIPFGFPHFPPSCKPKSDIFHPDFDPAAICLGDFWTQDSQLHDLIIHIGQMINGETYSLTDAFNETAAIWYRNHSDTFPLSEIQWRKNLAQVDKPEIFDKPHIDTLDENDLSTDYNFLSLDETKAEADFSQDAINTELESSEMIDFGFLQLLEDQKNFYSLRNHIKNKGYARDEVQNVFRKIEINIKKADDLHREATKHETLGDLQKALGYYKQIPSIVADFPHIDTHLNRITQALRLLENVTKEEHSYSQITQAPLFDQKGSAEKNFPSKPIIDAPVRKKADQQTIPKKILASNNSGNNKIFINLLVGIVVCIAAAAGYFYWSSSHFFKSATASFAQCSYFLDNEKFEAAKLSCESALSSIQRVRLIQNAKVEVLQNSINDILKSEKLLHGLDGKILVDGQYLPKKDAENLLSFRRMQKKADEFFIQKNWEQALNQFAAIMVSAQTNQYITAESIGDIQSKHDYAQFRMTYDSANTLLQEQKWQEAIAELNQAQTYLPALSEADLLQYTNSIQFLLAKGNFEKSRQQGDVFFAESDWENAKAAYERALSTKGTTESSPNETFEAVNKNIKRAELYALVDRGNKAFGSGAWDKAIDEYRKAETFLAMHQDLLDIADVESSRQKLSRIILQALIVRDRQLATSYLEKDDMAAAGKIYKKLVENIGKSSFSEEKEFLETKTELTATIHTLDDKIFLADKIQYLKNDYLTLFLVNYPAAIKENLVNPIITFSKNVGDKMVFKMQCTETGGGRPLTLILFYAFDKKTNTWEFFSEQ